MRCGDSFLMTGTGGFGKTHLCQQGVLSSPFTPRKIIAFRREAWGLKSSES